MVDGTGTHLRSLEHKIHMIFLIRHNLSCFKEAEKKISLTLLIIILTNYY